MEKTILIWLTFNTAHWLDHSKFCMKVEPLVLRRHWVSDVGTTHCKLPYYAGYTESSHFLNLYNKTLFSAGVLGMEAVEEHKRNWFYFIKLLTDNFTWALHAPLHFLNILLCLHFAHISIPSLVLEMPLCQMPFSKISCLVLKGKKVLFP